MDKTFEIFIVTQLGLEELSLKEFVEKANKHNFSYDETKTEKGGVSVTGITYKNACFLNHCLKIPTRILLRITSFKARDIPKLFNKTKKIQWNTFFVQKQIELKIKSKNSRLFDDRKINSTILQAINDYQRANEVKKSILKKNNKKNIELYIRAKDDIFTFSLDLTGKRLDLRENKILSSTAPIRSTIASAAIQYIRSKNVNFDTFIDPMAGTGTLPIEITNYDSYLDRDFSYKHYRQETTIKSYRNLTKAPKILVNDINKDCINIIKINFSNSNIVNYDIKNINALELFYKKDALVMCNPPYDVRIKTKKNLVKKLVKQLCDYEVKNFLLIYPKKLKPQNRSYKGEHYGPINNGGIDVYFSYIFKE